MIPATGLKYASNICPGIICGQCWSSDNGGKDLDFPLKNIFSLWLKLKLQVAYHSLVISVRLEAVAIIHNVDIENTQKIFDLHTQHLTSIAQCRVCIYVSTSGPKFWKNYKKYRFYLAMAPPSSFSVIWKCGLYILGSKWCGPPGNCLLHRKDLQLLDHAMNYIAKEENKRWCRHYIRNCPRLSWEIGQCWGGGGGSHIFKPFKEAWNRFPAWRNWFLGIHPWAP